MDSVFFDTLCIFIFLLCLCDACNLITIFYCVLLCHACKLITTVLKKNAPGGDLIRVDLIRFPGSIPGDII